jgi:hypothetical protein
MSSAQTQSISIDLPLPPSSLSPNGRSNYYAKNRDAQQMKMLGRNATNHHADPSWPWPSASAQIIWHHSGRAPDDDNAIASCKSIRDGIAEAGIVTDDRHIRTAGVQFVKVRKADEHLTIVLTREETDADIIRHWAY